jgi:hypothetical protein
MPGVYGSVTHIGEPQNNGSIPLKVRDFGPKGKSFDVLIQPWDLPVLLRKLQDATWKLGHQHSLVVPQLTMTEARSVRTEEDDLVALGVSTLEAGTIALQGHLAVLQQVRDAVNEAIEELSR